MDKTDKSKPAKQTDNAKQVEAKTAPISKHAPVFITGVAGFVGHSLAVHLLEAGHEVIGVDNLNDYYDPQLKEHRLSLLKEFPRFRFYLMDISDFHRMQELLHKHKPQVIFHLAAQAGVRYSIDKPFEYEKGNTLGTLSVLEAAKREGINRIVLASSSSVYGANAKIPFSETDTTDAPVSFYAATKKACEAIAHVYSHSYGLHITVLRFFTVYGPRGRPDMAYFKFALKMVQGKPIDVYNNGDLSRDFTYVEDIVNGVLLAWKNATSKYEIINLGGDHPVKLLDFIRIIEKELGVTAKLNMLPMQTGDVFTTYADLTKARKLIGYNPKVSIEKGLHEFAVWFKENKDWLLTLEDPK